MGGKNVFKEHMLEAECKGQPVLYHALTPTCFGFITPFQLWCIAKNPSVSVLTEKGRLYVTASQ